MKTKIKLIVASLALVVTTLGAQAQTINSLGGSTTPPTNFMGSVSSYLTQLNPEFTFTNVTMEVSVGADYNSGLNWASYITAQYDMGRWGILADFRNIGIGGTIQGIEAGGGYALFEKYDTKLEAFVMGGYSFDHKRGVAEPGVVVRKKGTANTFFELGVTWPIYFGGPQNTSPNIRVGTGFTF